MSTLSLEDLGPKMRGEVGLQMPFITGTPVLGRLH